MQSLRGGVRKTFNYLNKNPLNTIYQCQNLEALSNILPLSEILKNIYLPYYLYNNLTLGDEKMLIMPYYIITSKYLLTISSDFKTVSLHDSDTVIRVYRKEFYRIFNMAQPLIKYADNTFKIINHLQENYIELRTPVPYFRVSSMSVFYGYIFCTFKRIL